MRRATPIRCSACLPLRTSFRERRLHLGYRRLTPFGPGPWTGPLRAHEFHYTAIVSEGPGEPLFTAEDARGEVLGDYGLRRGSVCGSFLHLIDGEA